MVCPSRYLILAVLWVGLHVVNPNASNAQERYQPSTPTVSPYLNLFQNRNNNLLPNGVPNYYTLVRPLQQQQQFQESQQRLAQQQAQSIQLLKANLNSAQQRQAEGPLVAHTGVDSKFEYPGRRYSFLNSSKYYPTHTAQTAH
jgi:hypothetical protein